MNKALIFLPFLAAFIFPVVVSKKYVTPEKEFLLAKDGKAEAAIIIPPVSSGVLNFAASELAKYLKKISGAVFVIDSVNTSYPAIILTVNEKLKKESYTIIAHDRTISIEGGSGRAVLYAVYDLLGRLGCRWLTPAFDFYKGQDEYIPHKATLYWMPQNIRESPAFAYRKIDIEEGRSHNIQNLKQMIDWMPKLRFNTLMIPLDYGGSGHVKWDNWREELTPDLKKRGLMIEVGGHGYQNFLNAGMPAISPGAGKETLFKQHPEWFGKDKNCKAAPEEYLVFNTANDSAVNYFLSNISSYIRQHPEIDIFDCWPPDGARWNECPAMAALGTPQDRQALLVNQVDSTIKKIRPGLQLEIIAYARALLPPGKVPLNKDILIDFCPINQSFEKQINDPSAKNNAAYINAICSWRKDFSGNIGLYSYYRKYGWRSLPVIIPHYMQHDIQWYARVPLQGICSYAEPGDWGTYELNHYLLGYLAWDPYVNVDSLIRLFCTCRYGSASGTAEAAYTLLEQTVRVFGNIPYTQLKASQKIADAKERLIKCEKEINRVSLQYDDTIAEQNLSRLSLMLQYAIWDLQIQEYRSQDLYNSQVGKTSDNELATVKKLVQFLKENNHKGIFLVEEKNVLSKLMSAYGIKHDQLK